MRCRSDRVCRLIATGSPTLLAVWGTRTSWPVAVRRASTPTRITKMWTSWPMFARFHWLESNFWTRHTSIAKMLLPGVDGQDAVGVAFSLMMRQPTLLSARLP